MRLRPDADPVLAGRYQQAANAVAVYSAHADGERRLRLHPADIAPAAQAAALRLDPITDRDEYAALADFLASENTPTIEALSGSDDPEARHLGRRLANLGVDRYAVWARGQAGSVLDAVHDESIRCVVIDLGSLPTREEQSLVATVVLGDLWRHRAERRPVLIVIDEAHNVCPAEPLDPLAALATERAIRIAAEGRKFGLYLLVSTQRPQKIPQNVLSQADNLVLLRLQLAGGRRLRPGRVLVRPARADPALGHVPAGRGPDRRKDLARARAASLRRADQRGGRR